LICTLSDSHCLFELTVQDEATELFLVLCANNCIFSVIFIFTVFRVFWILSHKYLMMLITVACGA